MSATVTIQGEEFAGQPAFTVSCPNDEAKALLKLMTGKALWMEHVGGSEFFLSVNDHPPEAKS